MSEKNIQTNIFLAASRNGATIFRNNCGVAVYPDGSRVKYGICNPGGSDLIGWQSIKITPDMVGQRMARFVALEVKSTTGIIKKEQINFIDNVRKAGGIAGVVRTTDDAIALLNPLL